MAACAALALAACGGDNDGDTSGPSPSDGGHADGSSRPNILFVLMDDVGIDQMASFGYGGATPPDLPNMDAVAAAGVRFRNTWSMPECSPGRAAFFAGRYPFRTGIYQAIGQNDLANSQLSPYEVTAPKLLKQAGYQSAMFGKFHLAGPEHNQAGNSTPAELGWDYFYGWIGGLPGSIDTTAGGVAPEKTYTCGFVPAHGADGASFGACYHADGSCEPFVGLSPHDDSPGLQCLDAGGIFVPEQTCGVKPATLNFDRENAYYVSPLVVIDDGHVEQVPLSDPRSRGYRTRIEADAAIDWIKGRQGSGQPWMATVSFSAAHTPLQQPPGSLLAAGAGVGKDALDCASTVQGRTLQNQMTEAMDAEFGRILVETGLATRDGDGKLVYDPGAGNTVIVIAGDNGSLGYSVKLPFDPTLAKGTAYQTGIWVPLIVAGPPVKSPGRDVEHMVNAVDVFQLFGELAGIDVHKAVPRAVDSAPLFPYLKDPATASQRTINFSMAGFNYQADGGRNGPCVMNATSCTQIPVSKSVCEDNLGVWWGPGYDDASVVDNGGAGYQSCCQVNQALFKKGQAMIDILPESAATVRNDSYKLVQNTVQAYDSAADTCGTAVSTELYAVDQAKSSPQLEDPATNNLLARSPVPAEAQSAYDELLPKLEAMLAANPDCPGDGNQDGVVDDQDRINWQAIAQDWGLSSVYDFVIGGIADGVTDGADGLIVQQNMDKECPKSHVYH